MTAKERVDIILAKMVNTTASKVNKAFCWIEKKTKEKFLRKTDG